MKCRCYITAGMLGIALLAIMILRGQAAQPDAVPSIPTPGFYFERGFEMKRCPGCDTVKELGKFGSDRSAKNGKGGYCKECRSSKKKIKYRTDPVFRANCIKNSAKIIKEKYAKNMRLKNEYLNEHPCVDCGNTDVRVLDFDHIRGEKRFNISEGILLKWKDIIKEIDKCDIRCANCHRIRHAEEE